MRVERNAAAMIAPAFAGGVSLYVFAI